MDDGSADTPFAAIIVAAGKGMRAGQTVPKQFALWRGEPVLRHSARALSAAGADPLVIAIPPGEHEAAIEALGPDIKAHLVGGGETRQQSVANALEFLADHPPERVLIHDAARPQVDPQVIGRILAALEGHDGAIPVLPVVDSLVIARDACMEAPADRDAMRRVQTPQGFRFAAILAAHRGWQGEPVAGDDAQVLRAAGHEVALVEGDEQLAKLTFAGDFMSEAPQVRTGMGFDVHRLEQGETLWLGGIEIAHTHGLAGHSDADVALHALVDALLGAIGDGDIGSHFPPSDPQWKGAPSSRFVEHAASRVREAAYSVANVDLTIICEAPKIGPHREAMRTRIAQLLSVDTGAISVKATTTERLGMTGRGEGIAAQAIATLIRR
ncbi:bifunctional 2-C-methyl-D-erythritol 4-phosphate cytidylyltransferase/2-C-methyl-D-erythritol 2,4-cyclodiphosphate synthase [Erythrobacter sp. 3-20A1M]|uniref:bifunctional 2-C-methyl-D-erythritol 4-phosphate cytidylyltransferase/2-C-methyl-D-erythritol 2,4-cyclodiphosphate synthase n=1 Tax=Erythrobacter sp. 3-20A1M TaxID=2653850 RepID=UPI001BFCBFE2|nr:bifunctional 2-C-methyl-D-erythritol 4-phosphate cytidylyltransferase/2-C-methyl-D-erythritol 2,4-cyclodiphosphate synthase [Erythrobacter sp. 3-20A1M]QWC58131.1 bifunctional 2-C-methyl-D-erythritol 4-phosphate cytidylyltransferase/2-C-methyl-D-erythritol 2,4-cyclodiphosphate synthase [Erythrobacter sp. 3-20A1M]